MQFEFIARKNNGGYNDGDPPLPIPNREVKPISADDTAIPSGKVGSRQLIETFSQKWLEVFFLCGIASCPLLTLPSLLCCTPLTLQLFWCPLIISTAELPFFVVSVHLTSLPLPAHQDHPINRITDKPGMWTKTDHWQTLWGKKFIFYEIHRRLQPSSESILRGVGLFCETILLHRRQQPHPEASPRHIGGFSELHEGRTFSPAREMNRTFHGLRDYYIAN